MLTATLTPTVEDSNPGALAVTSHRPPRIPRMAHSPLSSLVAVNSFGMVDGFTARMVAALIGWPARFFTVPVSRPTSGCAAEADASARTAKQAAARAVTRRGECATRTPFRVCASLPS